MADTVQLEVVITSTGQTTRRLQQMVGAAMKDLKSTMDEVGQMVAEFAEGPVFESEGGILGEVWPRLSPAYAKYKGKHSMSNELLEFTGTMRKSFAWNASEGGVDVGNNAPYFEYHQSTEEHTKIPRRAMIGFTDELQEKIKTKIRDDIIRKINE